MSFVRNTSVTLVGAIAISLSILSLLGVSPAIAAQWLQNSSFDSDTTGWEIPTLTTGCGSGEASVAVDDSGAFVRQSVSQVLQAGEYRFLGSARLLSSGPVSATAAVLRLNSGTTVSTAVALSTATSSWSLPISLDGTTGVRVSLTLISDDAPVTVCVDDLSFEGPLVAEPPPTATATPLPPTPTHTSVPATSATSTATATSSSVSPTSTFTSAVPTSTSIPATATSAVATPTQAAATATSTTAPGLTFVNGGFEDGTYAWRTQGGELDAVASPRSTGSAAGRFTSTTGSTKFVYQTIAIDPAQHYEFQGALMTEGAVSEAFLRVAWYSSGDGSGSQMETVDSPDGVGPLSGAFINLSTGALQPPPGARSARLRVVLVPSSGAPATVYLDDFLFHTTAAPTPAPTQTGTVAPATTAAPGAAQVVDTTAEPGRTPRPGVTSEVAAARATSVSSLGGAAATVTSTPRNRNSSPDDQPETEPGQQDDAIWPYLVAGPLVALFGAGGYFYSKRRQTT